MRNVFGIAIVCCIIGLLVAPVSAKELSVKVGGAALAGDETIFGPTVAVNIPTSALEGRLNIQPFVEAYISKKWFKVAGGGLNVVLKHEAGEGLNVFAGAGGGAGHVRYRGKKKTGGMVNVLAGIEFAASEKVSVFAQGKYTAVLSDVDYRYRVLNSNAMRTKTVEVKDLAVQAGIMIQVGQ